MASDPKTKIPDRRHAEWRSFWKRSRWLLDSLEGGQRYRDAEYGQDTRGLPVRNLIRHKREYPDRRESQASQTNVYPSVPPSWLGGGGYDDDGHDPATYATDDDYELRRARTPVPTFVREALDNDIGQIYGREVKRVGPAEAVAWWADVDGKGTSMDRWMAEEIAETLMVVGGLDLQFDRPEVPEGEQVRTIADEVRLKLRRCLATYILPENMLWWRLNKLGDRYEECLVQECVEDDEGKPTRQYRHWTTQGWTLYNQKKEQVASGTHGYGVVPIVRVFDRRKSGSKNLPRSRYHGIAERQREYYNRDSELILSDVLHAHPLLQGPEDYVEADGSVPIGPSWMLPKKKDQSNGGKYEGFEFLTPSSDPADSIRLNLDKIRHEVDRDAHLAQPSGDMAIAKGTIEQSGISKSIDQKPAHDRLVAIATTLQRAEIVATEIALLVITNGKPPKEKVDIVYPANFDLYSASDVAVASDNFMKIGMQTGMGMPDVEEAILKRLARLMYPGLPDADYAQFDANIKAFIAKGGGLGVQADQLMQQLNAKAALSPAGQVRNGVHDPTERQQPPGQTGKPRVNKKKSG